MNKKGMKVAACALASAILVSGFTIPADASMFVSGLPVAGAALALREGTSVDVVQKQVAEMEDSNKVTKSEGGSQIDLASVELTAGEAAVVAPASASPELVQMDVITPAPVAEQTVAAEAAAAADTVSANTVDPEAEKFKNLVIADVNDYVNVRSTPSEDGEIVGKLYDESVGEFVSEAEGGWYEITSGSVTGFVKAEYVVTGDAAVAMAKEVGKRIATVTTTTLKVRESASLDAPVIGLVPIEDELLVKEETDGFVKVDIEEGEGFVSTDYVTLSTEFVKAESKAEEEARLAKEEAERKKANAAADGTKGSKGSGEKVTASAGSGRGSSVASYACQFVGNPYVYGGSSLTNGTDCSGFVMSVYANYGVGLPHSSGALRGVGSNVGGLANAQPGDIVCYSGHVAIYIGNGQIVHASTEKTGIKISNADYKQVLSVRRIF